MDKSGFKLYIKNYIESLGNLNDKAKANFFIGNLKDYMGKEALNNPDVFSVLDQEFLLDSIEMYIKEKHPVKGVAEDYRRTIISLCEAVCQRYGVKNSFLESAVEQKKFNEITKEWFENLKQSESRECISSKDSEILEEAIRSFFNTDELEEKIQYSIENIHTKPNYYGWMVSAIALKLIQNFGLDNGTIVNLKVSDLNMENRTIDANGFKLPISEELLSCFELYMKRRNLIVQSKNETTDFLFVKRNGASYCDINQRPDCGQLFLIMDSTLHHTTTTGLRYRRIIELVSKGANINLLFQLTGVKREKIAEICVEDKTSLERLLGDTSNNYIYGQKKFKKGLIRCPFCGNYKDASSDN